MSITGECFCGEITYEVKGSLRDARSCHCSRCRKAFSSQSSSVAFLDPGDFRWVLGSSNLKSYVGKHGYGYQFCKNCGSTLSIVFHNEIIGVTLGCVNGDPEVEIGMHVYVGSKAAWETLPEGVLQYQEGPPNA